MTAIQNRTVSHVLRRIVGALSVLLLPISSAAALEEVCAEMKIGVNSNVKAVILFQGEDGSQLGKTSESFGHGEFVCMPIPNGLEDNQRFRVVYQIEPLSHEIPCGADIESRHEADEEKGALKQREKEYLDMAQLKDKEYGFLTPSVDLDRMVFTLAKQGCVFLNK